MTQTQAQERRRVGLIAGVVILVFAVLTSIIVVLMHAPAGAPAAAPARTASYQPPQTVDQMAQAVADRRAAALRAGDEQAWLADLDPAAAELIAAEKWRFANLRQLAPPVFVLRSGRFDTARPQLLYVQQIMQLASDVQPTRNAFEWTMRYDGGRAVITKVTKFAEPGKLLESYGDSGAERNVPWDDAPLRSAAGSRVTVLAPVASKWQPDTYLPGALRAAALVRSLWKGRPGAPGFTVFLADDKQFEQWFGFVRTTATPSGTRSSGGWSRRTASIGWPGQILRSRSSACRCGRSRRRVPGSFCG